MKLWSLVRRCSRDTGVAGRTRRGKRPPQRSTMAERDVFSGLEWRREGGVMQTVLQSMNSLRVPLVHNTLLGLPAEAPPTYHAPLPLTGYSVLDVGCGAGYLTEPLARLGAKVTGLEPSREVLSEAERHLTLDPELSSRVEYRCLTLEEMREMEDRDRERGREVEFDCVVASEVAEHVRNLSLFLHLLTSFTKPGGHVVLTTINRTLESYLAVIAGAEYLLRLLPRGTHNWSQFITPQELVAGLERNEAMKVDWIRGMWFNPVTLKWTWSDSDRVNYAVRARKCV